MLCDSAFKLPSVCVIEIVHSSCQLRGNAVQILSASLKFDLNLQWICILNLSASDNFDSKFYSWMFRCTNYCNGDGAVTLCSVLLLLHMQLQGLRKLYWNTRIIPEKGWGLNWCMSIVQNVRKESELELSRFKRQVRNLVKWLIPRPAFTPIYTQFQ